MSDLQQEMKQGRKRRETGEVKGPATSATLAQMHFLVKCNIADDADFAIGSLGGTVAPC